MWSLVLAHLVGDFLLQRKYWALNKTSKLSALLIHCVVYTAAFIPVFWMYEVCWAWLAWIFLTHVLIDNGHFVNWWSRVVNDNHDPVFWLLVVRDQVIHLLVLVVIAGVH